MNISFLRRSRLLSGLFTAVLAAGIVAGTAAPASAGNSHKKIDYVALGDSYAAGQGGGRSWDDCNHTKAAYPRAVDKLRGVRLIADGTCTRADTWDLLKVQIPALKWKLKKAELVTITIGANDILTEKIIDACDDAAPTATTAPEEDRCAKLVHKAVKKVKERVLKALLRIDDLNHKVKILVTGYPYLYEPSTDPFATRVNAGVDALNGALHWAVKKAKHWGVHAKYLDVTGIFAGHGIGSADPWIHADGADRWHPNQKGHWAYRHVVVHKVKHLF